MTGGGKDRLPFLAAAATNGDDEGMTQVTDGPGADGFREDVRYGLRESLSHDTALKNAPETDGIFFEVPKVIER